MRSIVQVFACIFLMASGIGCTKLSERTHAMYEIGDAPKVRPAEPGGLYEIKWAHTAQGPLHTLAGSQRLIRQGDLVGFGRDANGRVWAIVGQELTAIANLPPEARVCVWSTQVPSRTALGKSADVAEDVAKAGFGLAALAGLFVAKNELDQASYDDTYSGGTYDMSSQRSNNDNDSSGQPAAASDSRGAVPWASPPITR